MIASSADLSSLTYPNPMEAVAVMITPTMHIPFGGHLSSCKYSKKIMVAGKFTKDENITARLNF